MNSQKSSCTRTGVALKNQIYSQLVADRSGLVDSRITASTTPKITPIAIALTVSSSVSSTPSRILWSKRYSPTTCHSIRLLVATEWTSEPPNIRIRAAEAQRPRCRTGTALISSGRRSGSGLSVASAVDTSYLMSCSACGAVDRGGGDRRALDFPLLEDREIRAVGYEHL